MPERNDYTYEADDGYVYPGGDVLINRFGIRDEGRLAEVERAITGVRYAELEERPIPGNFDLDHLCAIHRHLFGDIYPWAGKIRTRGFLSKGGSIFCMPEFITSYARELFDNLGKESRLKGLGRGAFVKRMAFYIAEINALHPFREGNGRTQRAFANQLARNAGWELNLKDIDPQELCDAYIESMHRSAGRLEALLREHLRPMPGGDRPQPHTQGDDDMSHLGQDIKKLGFGLMRLPKQGEAIDVEQVKAMVDAFLDAGFTYFDTAWAYPGSEEAIRQALVERHPRERFQLATKLAAWIECKSREDALAQFETSLRRTGAGYFDFYLLHNLGEARTRFFDDYGLWDWAQEQKARGLIKHLGFSFHSTPEELEEILRKHPEMEFVQLQINYADWENPAVQSRGCYEVARKYGKPVVIMEPVKGGMLATPPQAVADILKQAEPDSSIASWAIRFAANLEGVITVLSGMSNMEQMRDNLAFMKNFTKLTAEQERRLAQAREIIQKYPVIPCTTCNYCAKVCPNNIGISGSFTAMNYLTLYGDKAAAAHQEQWLVEWHGKARASECVACGECEAVCPQHIAIREELAKVAAAFGMQAA